MYDLRPLVLAAFGFAAPALAAAQPSATRLGFSVARLARIDSVLERAVRVPARLPMLVYQALVQPR